MPARTLKRSVTISGHRTSVSLEAEFWDALVEIAAAANLNPKSIYRALGSSGNPEFATVF